VGAKCVNVGALTDTAMSAFWHDVVWKCSQHSQICGVNSAYGSLRRPNLFNIVQCKYLTQILSLHTFSNFCLSPPVDRRIGALETLHSAKYKRSLTRKDPRKLFTVRLLTEGRGRWYCTSPVQCQQQQRQTHRWDWAVNLWV